MTDEIDMENPFIPLSIVYAWYDQLHTYPVDLDGHVLWTIQLNYSGAFWGFAAGFHIDTVHRFFKRCNEYFDLERVQRGLRIVYEKR